MRYLDRLLYGSLLMHISSTTHISTHRKRCHCVGLLLFRGVIELGEKKENTYQSLINCLF